MTAARLVGPSHAAVMAAIHACAFPPAECWSAAAIASLLAQPGTFAILDAEAAMLLARVAAEEAEILTLATLPPQRRAGRARAVLAMAEAQAQAMGAVRMFLEVAATNHAALALYASTGYRPAGRRPRYYSDGGDALLLARNLIPAATTNA